MKWTIKLSRKGRVFAENVENFKGLSDIPDGKIACAFIRCGFEVCRRQGVKCDTVAVMKGSAVGRPFWSVTLDG